MKILFVVYSMSGGAGKQLSLTSNALADFGHDVTIYAYHWSQNPVYPLSDKVCFIPERDIFASTLKEYFFIPFRIRETVKAISADIVIGWRTNAGALIRIACSGLSVKTIFAERSDPYMEHSPKLAIAKFFCNYCNYGVFQTEKAKDYYKRLKKNSIVISNPFSQSGGVDSPLPFTTRDNEIVVAGRFFMKQKRQDIALKAFSIFRSKHTEYKLVFCGEGDDLQYVKNMVKEMNLTDYVVFEGLVSDMKSRVRNSKAFLLTSDYEGIPNVILEAFLWGLPVVTTDCSPGGARVLVDDGENGFVVPCGDVDAIACRLDEIVSNIDLAESFIASGQKKITEFAPDAIFEKWNNFILQVK